MVTLLTLMPIGKQLTLKMNKPILNIKDSYNMHIVDQHKGGGGFDRGKLLSEWLFNNDFLDTSGNGITLSESGSVNFATNRHSEANSCIEIIDGTPGELYSRSAFDLGSFSNWAFSGWIYAGPDFGTNRSFWIAGDIDQTGNNASFAKIIAGANMVYIQNIDTGATISEETWVHLAFNANVLGSLIDVYKDGVFQSQTSITTFSKASEIAIGVATALGGSSYWRGKLDDFRFFNDMLTADEITFLAHEGE